MGLGAGPGTCKQGSQGALGGKGWGMRAATRSCKRLTWLFEQAWDPLTTALLPSELLPKFFLLHFLLPESRFCVRHAC